MLPYSPLSTGIYHIFFGVFHGSRHFLQPNDPNDILDCFARAIPQNDDVGMNWPLLDTWAASSTMRPQVIFLGILDFK